MLVMPKLPLTPTQRSRAVTILTCKLLPNLDFQISSSFVDLVNLAYPASSKPKADNSASPMLGYG